MDARATLEELKAKRLEREVERAKKDADESLASEIETEERKLKELDTLDELEAKYGAKSIKAVETDAGMVVVKRPAPVVWKRFRDKGKTDTTALDELVGPCLVYPSREAFNKMVEDRPFVLDQTANGVCTLAGVKDPGK